MLRSGFLAFMAFLFAGTATAQTNRYWPADDFQINVLGNTITISAPAVTASYGLAMPPAQATANGQTLLNNGSGVLSWGNPASAITGTAPIIVTPTASGANISITTPIPVSAGGTGVVGTTVVYPATGTVITASGPATLSNKTLASPVTTGGETYQGATAGSVIVQAAASGAAWTFTYPASAGANGYVLLNTGSGNTAWSSLGFIAGYMVNGSRASPNNISAGGGVTTLGQQREMQFIQGSGGAVVVTANPAIAGCSGSNVGAELLILGRSDTNTVTFNNGNGLSLNGSIIMGADGAGASLLLDCDGVNWDEVSRR